MDIMKQLVLLLLFFTHISFAQNSRIAFYNVENLFDTINDPTLDDDFTQNGKFQWDYNRYLTKIQHINNVLDSMQNPVMVGFAEIEKKQVLVDLIKYSPKRLNYGIVHQDSPDERGIDVGLIYDQTKFILLDEHYIRYQLAFGAKTSTRDILCAKFLAKTDTLFVIVNHWPSRRNGKVESEGNRLKAAAHANNYIDSIQNSSPDSKILFMGDLNDYPEDMSVQMINELLNPMINEKSGEFGGTYSYRNEFNVLDHIFVSKNFEKGKFKVIKKSGTIFSAPWMMEEFKGQIQPKRTFAGSKYLAGYSDHLPVLVEVKLP